MRGDLNTEATGTSRRSQLQEDASKLEAGSAGRQANSIVVESLKLVSRQLRQQPLALWAAGRGFDPFFTAIVF